MLLSLSSCSPYARHPERYDSVSRIDMLLFSVKCSTQALPLWDSEVWSTHTHRHTHRKTGLQLKVQIICLNYHDNVHDWGEEEGEEGDKNRRKRKRNIRKKFTNLASILFLSHAQRATLLSEPVQVLFLTIIPLNYDLRFPPPILPLGEPSPQNWIHNLL